MSVPAVAVIGYLSLDRIEGPAGRFEQLPGGSALYAALAAARCGARVHLIACAGNDFPSAILDTLCARGILLDGVVRLDEPCRRARLVEAEGAVRRSPHHDAAAWWAATLLFRPPLPTIEADAFVLGPMPGIYLHEQIVACRALGGQVLADTSEAYAARSPDLILDLLPDLDLFAPSLAESRLLCPDLQDDEAVRALGRRCPIVVQKRGAEGLVMARAGAARLRHCPSAAGGVVEATGAGDAILGALAVGLTLGLDDRALLANASAVAAEAVAAPGPLGLLSAHGVSEATGDAH